MRKIEKIKKNWNAGFKPFITPILILLLVVCFVLSPLLSGDVKGDISENNTNYAPSLMCLSGTILFVGGHGPGNYSTIQEAIESATDGDTVFVYDDSSPYYETVQINKSLSVIGENKETTIIDAQRRGSVINISANSVTLTGFTIKNSSSNQFDYFNRNGILCMDDSSYISITGNKLENTIVGCLLIHSTYCNISYNTISGGVGYMHKSCIFLTDSSAYNTIISNVFIKSINSLIQTTLLIEEGSHTNYFSNNIIDISAGRIFIENSNNITISQNVNCPSIELYSSPSCQIKNNHMNSADHIFLDIRLNSNYTIIDNNTHYGTSQFRIHLFQSHRNTISNNTILKGYIPISLYSSNNNIVSNNTVENSTHLSGCCLARANNNIISGNTIRNNPNGIYIYSESNNNIIRKNRIENNEQYGVYLREGESNKFYHNLFAENDEGHSFQEEDIQGINYWDNGFPSGGNFWDDYTKRYPDASEINNSGIWNTPYEISPGDIYDYYPLMGPHPIFFIDILGESGYFCLIKNIGEADAYEVNWEITIEGGFRIRNDYYQGSQGYFAIDDEILIDFTPGGIGLGIFSDPPKATVSVTAVDFQDKEFFKDQSVNVRIFGPWMKKIGG